MAHKKRKILGVTGIRSEYDIMSSVYQAIKNHPSLELELLVTGAHLSPLYGNTVKEIETDGFRIVERIYSLLNTDSAAGRVRGAGLQLASMAQSIERLNPDFLLVLGDREEALTTAMVGAYMNIPVAHISGGDRVVGNVDDQVRHAVTKLAHLHFVTNQESYERIIKLGEQAFRVFNVGNPGLDRLLTTSQISTQELSSRLEIDLKENEPLLVVLQHPISSESSNAYEQMETTLKAIEELALQTILIFPNSDAGSQQIIYAIDKFSHLPFIKTIKNLPRLEFVNLLRRASCLIGNSSLGILEAPLLKLAVVNIGERQKGRLHAENVQFVTHEKLSIVQAIKKALFDNTYKIIVAQCSNPYGDGHSAKKIANILAETPLDRQLLIKDITY